MKNEERGIGPHGQEQGCAGQFFLLHYYCFIILSSSLNRHNFFIFLCQKFFNLRDIFIVFFHKVVVFSKRRDTCLLPCLPTCSGKKYSVTR